LWHKCTFAPEMILRVQRSFPSGIITLATGR
jgi:hypothetical protein